MQAGARNLLIVSGVSLLTDLSTEMGFPLLVTLLATTGGSGLTLGVMEGLAEAVSSFVKLASGRRSDRLQRRKGLTLLGYGLSCLLKFAYPFAQTPAQLVTLRAGDRFGKGIRGAPRDALIADSMPPSRWGFAFGFHRAMDTVGALVGPLVGIFLVWAVAFDERQVLLAAAVPALLGVGLLFFVREPAPPPGPRRAPAPFPHDPALFSYLLTVGVYTMGNFGAVFLVLRAAEAGMGLLWVLGVYAAFNAAYAGLALPLGGLADRVGRAPIVGLGFAATALAGLLVVQSGPERPPEFFAPALFLGLASAAFEGNGRALAAAFAPAPARATVLGAYHATIGAAALPAGILAGLLWAIDYRLAFAVASVFALTALAELSWMWGRGQLPGRAGA